MNGALVEVFYKKWQEENGRPTDSQSFWLLKHWFDVPLNKTFLLYLSHAVILREKTSDKYLTFQLNDHSIQNDAKICWELKQPNNLYSFVLKPKSKQKKNSQIVPPSLIWVTE